MTPEEHRKRTNLELWGLYKLQRNAHLNVLYYAARASSWSKWNLRLQIVASAGSPPGAVTGFISGVGGDTGKWLSAFVGAASAACAALPAIMGHSEKINRFEHLHCSYSDLFQLASKAAMDVRRSGLVTGEQIGEARTLADLYSRLGHMDETERKSKLAKESEQKVREKFPKGKLWYAKPHMPEKPKPPEPPQPTPIRKREEKNIPLTEYERPGQGPRIEPEKDWDDGPPED